MCLAVPGKITALQDQLATVAIGEVTREVSTMLLPEAAVGMYVLIHAGFAIQSIDAEEAEKTWELIKELERLEAAGQ